MIALGYLALMSHNIDWHHCQNDVIISSTSSERGLFYYLKSFTSWRLTIRDAAQYLPRIGEGNSLFNDFNAFQFFRLIYHHITTLEMFAPLQLWVDQGGF